MTTPARTLRMGQPLWLPADDRAAPMHPPLIGRHTSDAVVVGGGITGALIAEAFSSAGISTIVLEAARVGRGSTAASSALLLQEPDRGLSELHERYGGRTSRRIWQLSHSALAELVALLERHRVPCELRQRDTIYYATSAAAAEDLARELTVRKRAGFQGEWLSAGELRRLTAIPGAGAIRTHGGAQCDPYRACAGVLDAAVTLGTRVFERSPVVRITHQRNAVRVATRRGAVDARRVIIATGYATRRFKPLAGRFRMYRTYVLATEPIGAADCAEIGLSDVMVWNTARPYHYARWTADHRLLLGGADRPLRAGQRRHTQFDRATRELRGYFDALLPALVPIRTQCAWEGLFAITSDSLPYIGPHRRYPGHWFALGYGGNGMTFGSLAARLLLERWQGVRSRDHALFQFDRDGGT